MSEIEPLLRLQEAKRVNEKLRRAKALRESYGINFYRPHVKQDRFHSSPAIGRYGRTGNRFGKSEMGMAEDIAWCMGGRVWYRETFDVLNGDRTVARHHEGGRNHPLVTQGIPPHPVKGLLIVVDWDMAKSIFTNNSGSYETWGKLFKLVPREALGKVHYSRGGHIDQVNIKRLTEFGGGESTLSIDTIQSFKQSKLSGESADWDFIHVDEPCPEDMFKAYSRGLMDRNGSYWFTCTPLDEMWINDRFVPQKGAIVERADNGKTFGTKFIITGSVYDNPYRTEAGVAEFESGLTREERECRLFGIPLAMAGLIYKEFVYDLHVLCDPPLGWEDFNRPPKDYTVRIWWDYHIRLPQAVLFFATDPKGRVFVYDELFESNLIDDVAKSVVDKTNGYLVADKEIDPLAIIEHPVTGESIVDELCKYGLFFNPATKDLSRGINAVRKRLAERDPQGMPTIFFSPHLTQTLFEFTHYVYDVKKNEPKDDHNHMMENLYRAILNGLAYYEPITDEVVTRRNRPFVVNDPGNLHDFSRSNLSVL